MELRHVKSFLRLAQELHFGRAAAELNLSVPALSQHIKSLEKDLRVQLFDRDRRGVQLTEAGLTFLPHAQRLLRTADSAVDEMRSLAQGTSGIIRVGLFVNNAAELTVPILQRFRTTFPNVQINFVPLDFAGQVNGIVEERVDVAFVRPPITHESIDVRILGYEPRVAVVSRQSELADADAISIDTLAERQFIDAAAIPMPAEWTKFWLLLNERNENLPAVMSDARLDDFDAVSMDIALNDTTTTVPASLMRDFSDQLVTGVPISDLSCALAIATHIEASPLSQHFRGIAERTAKDLISLVPDASYSEM